MTKENLFEDMTAEEMRQRLQEVSEYMDELIKRRRCLCKLAGDDVREDAQWNLAHDVLEIIHCTEESPLSMAIVDVVDARIAQHMRVMRGEVQKAFDELGRRINQSFRR